MNDGSLPTNVAAVKDLGSSSTIQIISAAVSINGLEKSEMKETFKNQCWGPVIWNVSRLNHNGSGDFSLQVILLMEPGQNKVMPRSGDDHVIEHLGRLFQNGTRSDVDFVVKGQVIPGHSLIIQGGSPVFAAMFEHDMIEKKTKAVEIPDIEPKVFRQLLQYLYTGDAPELEEDSMTEPLFLAADKYQVDSLKDWCSSVMSKKMKIDDVIHLLVFAHLHSAGQLQEDCLSFIVKNKAVFWTREDFKQLSKNYSDLFYEATKRMND